MMGPRETDPDRTSNCEHSGVHAVIATLEQVLAGVPVGEHTLELQCKKCTRKIRDGDEITVEASRMAEPLRWQLTRWWCPDCVPAPINSPTPEERTARCSCRVATISDGKTQHHWLCLLEPTVTAIVPPQVRHHHDSLSR